MALYEIQHRTAYQYASTVSTSHHAVRIEPLNGWGQTLHSFEFSVSPEPRDLVRKLDYFANPARFFSLTEPHQRLVVEGRSRVSVHPRAEIMAALTPTCEEVRRLMHTHRSTASLYATAFVYPSPRVPTLAQARDFAEHILQPDRPYLEAATALARKIHSSFAFKAGVTDAYTPIVDFLKAGKGVCQDFAHFMIACLRACALPAAYVSGYIRTNPPPGRPRLTGADASHAWVSIFIPDLGWVDIDPTNNTLVAEDHIAVARGRDYGDVSLIRGSILGGGAQDIHVAVTVDPIGNPAPTLHPPAPPIPHA